MLQCSMRSCRIQARTLLYSKFGIADQVRCISTLLLPRQNKICGSRRIPNASSCVSNILQLNRQLSSIVKSHCGLHIDTSLPHNFDKVLIANRGEIACRVIRTCRELGVKTVAVYSDADMNSQHVMMADESYRIGEAAAMSSYLLGSVILEIAKRSGAQAIHPGYGFLSENAEFCRQCKDAGIEFIGPPVAAIEAMGSKSASKDIMIKANVPCVPGYHGTNQDVAHLQREAKKVGYPLMIKAVLGGGGKGMRIVMEEGDFISQLDASKREAMKSFKDDRVLIERYIQKPRHIEFQVFADKQGNAVHLFERDCSVQRRHQKVLEEAPAPGMSAELRDKMGLSAVAAAKAVGYVGAGTVEFIFDSTTNDYFFMEMNTRLQVEHPVTEMIMKRDLVQWQLHVASGHALPTTQKDIYKSAYKNDKNNELLIGHSIEARIYAEDPDNDFLPATGHLAYIHTPDLQGTRQADNVRVETGVVQGDNVSIFYDPMISKLCVWAPSRPQALQLLHRCLQDYHIVGPPNNLPFLENCVSHPVFKKGQVTTNFIAENVDDLLNKHEDAPNHAQVLAIVGLLYREMSFQYNINRNSTSSHSSNLNAISSATSVLPSTTQFAPGDITSPWSDASAYRLNSGESRHITLLQRYKPSQQVSKKEKTEESSEFVLKKYKLSVGVENNLWNKDRLEKQGIVEEDKFYARNLFKFNLAKKDGKASQLTAEILNVWSKSPSSASSYSTSSASMSQSFEMSSLSQVPQHVQHMTVRVNDQIYKTTVVQNKYDEFEEVHVFVGDTRHRFQLPSQSFGANAGGDNAGVLSPMAGKLIKVSVTKGQAIKKGTPMAIMEAMKMEHVLRAQMDGVVDKIYFNEGDFVEGGKLVIALETKKKKE